jgi:CelD/BcsL family acetyltransferase involved in cellulose biosynthesis
VPILIERYRDPKALDDLADEWLALLQRSASDMVFLTPAYQRVWWRHLGEGELILLTAREDGDLVGVAPVFSTDGRVLQTAGCVEVTDYLDWISAPGREEEVLGAMLDFLAEVDTPAWNGMNLCNIHQASPTLDALPALARKRDWEVKTEVQEVCPVVDLPDTWDAYLDSLDGKDRRNLRRKLRRAEAAEEVRWYIVGPEHDLAEEVEDFLALMAKSAPEKAEFLTATMKDFFRELAKATFQSGWLQLSFLEWREQKLASYLSFVYGNRVLVYNSGLDWETFPKLGAGIVLTGYLIQRAIAEGRDEYDFLRGDEGYKYSFGGEDVTVHRVAIRR